MSKEERKPIRKYEDVLLAFQKYMMFDDTSYIRVAIANVIANQLDMDPVWTMFVAPPSGGKTEIIQALNDIRIGGNQTIWPISDLTPNAFMSGMKKTGKETSLLLQMPFGGILTFKDFTSILSKRFEDQVTIFSQLREIFDRQYEKRTGTGELLTWSGKIGAIGGCTQVIHLHMEHISTMGDRFMMYDIKMPDRERITDFVMKLRRNNINKEQMRNDARIAVKEYIEYIAANMHEYNIIFDEQTEKDIVSVADFCTKVRSGVITDRMKGTVEFVPEREMPMRMIEQLLTLGTALFIMDKLEPRGEHLAHIAKNRLSDSDLQILYKHAFNSIPIKRRIALKYLTRYKKGVTTAGLAMAIGYQTEVIRKWLAELNALGICVREKGNGPQGDTWKLKGQYRDIMSKFEKIQVIEEELVDSDVVIEEGDWLDEAYKAKEKSEKEAESESFDPKGLDF